MHRRAEPPVAEFVCVFCDYQSDIRITECPRCGRGRSFARSRIWRWLQLTAAIAWLAIGAVLAWILAWSVWPRPEGRNLPDAWWVLPLIGGLGVLFLGGGIAGLWGRPWLYRGLVRWFAGGWFESHGGNAD